jgi:hypothetical protein
MENSRMKDYFDLWTLLRDPTIDRPLAAKAVRATFGRRQTQLPTGMPLGLSAEFAVDALKTSQWNAFIARNKLQAPELARLIEQLRSTTEGLW